MNACRLSMWLICSVMAFGASSHAADPAPTAPPVVPVCLPVARQVASYEDFGGRIEAAMSVVLKSRVTGYLEQARVADGDSVKAGDVLFEIDARPYQAELAKVEADLAVSEARVRLVRANLERASALAKMGTIGREEVDKVAVEREAAEAGVQAARAARDVARIKLGFTKVLAPIDGRISRHLDVGNLVNADETVLATIVKSKPMHVIFDVDERTFLRAGRAVREGKLKGFAVTIGVGDEVGFPRQAAVDFVDSRVDAKTGAIRFRAVLRDVDELFLPGMSSRVRMVTGDPYQALLVPERAIQDVEGVKTVFVVNDKNAVEIRRVELGPRQADDLRVVKSGLKAGERVVLGGFTRLKAGTTVKPEEMRESPSGSESKQP